MTVISLEFASQVTWDLDALVDDIVGWLNVPFLSETSKVGIMSSPQFLAIIKGSIEDSIGVKFQRMIYAISLAYTQPTASDKHQLSTGELYQIGSMAGHDLLQYLDERLKPQPLSQCSQNDLRAMFLIVFGTILAVGYAIAEDLGPSREQKHQLKVMQNHLCQILAHYLIYLGSQLRLPIAAGTNQFILEAAPARWFKEGQFHWGTSFHYDSDSESDDELEDGPDAEWLDDHPSTYDLCHAGNSQGNGGLISFEYSSAAGNQQNNIAEDPERLSNQKEYLLV